jgi:hypothetical protein
VFTARCAVNPYIKQIRFVFKGSIVKIKLVPSCFNTETKSISWFNEGLRTQAKPLDLLPSAVGSTNCNSARDKINDLCFTRPRI